VFNPHYCTARKKGGEEGRKGRKGKEGGREGEKRVRGRNKERKKGGRHSKYWTKCSTH
jgi:hypothetical protein